jgi:hypothetical protein
VGGAGSQTDGALMATNALVKTCNVKTNGALIQLASFMLAGAEYGVEALLAVLPLTSSCNLMSR